MQSIIEWHDFDKDPPKKEGEYIVLSKDFFEGSKSFMEIMNFVINRKTYSGKEFTGFVYYDADWGYATQNYEIILWAEVPDYLELIKAMRGETKDKGIIEWHDFEQDPPKEENIYLVSVFLFENQKNKTIAMPFFDGEFPFIDGVITHWANFPSPVPLSKPISNGKIAGDALKVILDRLKEVKDKNE